MRSSTPTPKDEDYLYFLKPELVNAYSRPHLRANGEQNLRSTITAQPDCHPRQLASEAGPTSIGGDEQKEKAEGEVQGDVPWPWGPRSVSTPGPPSPSAPAATNRITPMRARLSH